MLLDHQCIVFPAWPFAFPTTVGATLVQRLQHRFFTGSPGCSRQRAQDVIGFCQSLHHYYSYYDRFNSGARLSVRGS
uniref:Uncharacterized protein n=1 Tax=Caenorhabditis japonica TaxID=281687 RepID=A0A8R1ICZ9_CAEJA